ncbi:hypothetical protein GOV05_05395 [Candidatus Woesearchaeota archaeon]|nr:hypothetical protein [Candidatus Woesearchaeota archaeon]
MFSNKEKEVFDENYLEGVLNSCDDIYDKIKEDARNESYHSIRNLIFKFFKVVLSESVDLVEEEVIRKLQKYDLKKAPREKISELFEELNSIDYGNEKPKKEKMYFILDAFKEVSKEVFISIKEHEKLKVDKKKINSKKAFEKFKKVLEKLKKQKIPDSSTRDLIIRASEYYDLLDDEKKNRYAKDYSYYCFRKPEVFDLLKKLEELKNEGAQEGVHQALVDLNKVYFKLDNTQKNEVFDKIISIVDASEEKLNMYIMMGYNFLHEKKLLELRNIYALIVQSYNELDNNKKNYYYGVLLRFNEFIHKKAVN